MYVRVVMGLVDGECMCVRVRVSLVAFAFVRLCAFGRATVAMRICMKVARASVCGSAVVWECGVWGWSGAGIVWR